MVLVLNKEIVFGSVAGETMILNTKTGTYYTLNQQGTGIWNLYYKGKTIREIKQYYADLYPESAEAIDQDVDSFFAELRIISSPNSRPWGEARWKKSSLT